MSDERACNNCGTTKWAAKNANFCTSCEHEWCRIFNLVFYGIRGENPIQPWVDSLIEEHKP